MKTLLISLAFFSFGLSAFAQQEQQTNDDQLQQQAPRETQLDTERAAIRQAERVEAEKKDAVIRQKEAELRAAEIRKDEEARAKAASKTK